MKYKGILVLSILFVFLVAFSGDKKPQPSVYAAAVSIPQAAAPVVNELENTTGSVITIIRHAAGQYRVQSEPPAFVVGRTIYSVEYHSMGPSITVFANTRCTRTDYCDLWLVSADPFGNSQFFYDGGTNGIFIPVQIAVYP